MKHHTHIGPRTGASFLHSHARKARVPAISSITHFSKSVVVANSDERDDVQE